MLKESLKAKLWILALVVALFSFRYLLSLITVNYLPAYRYNLESGSFDLQSGHAHESGNKNVEWRVSKLWMWWDSGLYYSIAQNGYDAKPFSITKYANWGFYPLYPIIVKYTSTLFGANTFDGISNVGIFLSLFFFYLALVALGKMLQNIGVDKKTIRLSLIFLAISPGAHFFHLFYTESLFLFLSLCVFIFMFKRNYWLMGLFLSLSLITRFNAVLLILPTAFYLFLNRKTISVWSWIKVVLILMVSFFPLFLFYLRLYGLTGEFWAAVKIQQGVWNNGFSPFGYFIAYFRDGGIGQIIYVVLLLICYYVLFITGYYLFKNRRNIVFKVELMAMWIYSFFSVFLFSGLSLGTSIHRLLSVVFPIFVLPLVLLKNRQYYFPTLVPFFFLSASLGTIFFISYLVNASVYSY